MIHTKILNELVSYGFSATLIYVRITFAGHDSHSVLVFTGKIYLSLSTRELRTEPSGMSKEMLKHLQGYDRRNGYFGLRE